MINSITVIGKRWFQKSSGNTYHSSEMLIDGVSIGKIDAYGNGNQYEWSAFYMAREMGFFKDLDLDRESPWNYTNRKEIVYHASVSDVVRRKDL